MVWLVDVVRPVGSVPTRTDRVGRAQARKRLCVGLRRGDERRGGRTLTSHDGGGGDGGRFDGRESVS